MVAAILLHYVIDDPLPTHGTFGDPGSNSYADIFFFCLRMFFFFSTCLVLVTSYSARMSQQAPLEVTESSS